MASYPISVRQYRSLQSRLLHSGDHSSRACDLLVLRALLRAQETFTLWVFFPLKELIIFAIQGAHTGFAPGGDFGILLDNLIYLNMVLQMEICGDNAARTQSLKRYVRWCLPFYLASFNQSWMAK
jgi:hypothetical protein